LKSRMSSKKLQFNQLMNEIKACEKCFSKAEKFVDVTKYMRTDLMFIAQAPSPYRTTPGLVLARNVKQLIDDVLKIFKRTREDVYMSNVVKCTILFKKTGDWMKCKDFIRREIEIIDPTYVILFGRIAVLSVLKKHYSLRGFIHAENIGNKIRFYATMYHPSAVLRNRISSKEFLFYAKKIASFLFDRETRVTDIETLERWMS